MFEGKYVIPQALSNVYLQFFDVVELIALTYVIPWKTKDASDRHSNQQHEKNHLKQRAAPAA